MTTPTLPKWQINLLAATFSMGALMGRLKDTNCILQVMAKLYPDQPEVVAAESRMLIQMNNFAGARVILERAEVLHPDNPTLKSMICFCLFAQRDGMWQTYAEQIYAMPYDEMACSIVRLICKAANVKMEPPPEMLEAEEKEKARKEAEEAAPSAPYVPPMGMVC